MPHFLRSTVSLRVASSETMPRDAVATASPPSEPAPADIAVVISALRAWSAADESLRQAARLVPDRGIPPARDPIC